MTEPLCPFCAKPLSDSATNRDHIFSVSLGAHQTIATHESCNHRLGDEVEGQLLKADGYLNLLRQNLQTARQVPGALANGTAVSQNLTSAELSFRFPIDRGAPPETVISGSRKQVAALLETQRGLDASRRKQLLDGAEQHSEGSPIEVVVHLDTTLLARYIAKVGLAALAYVDARSSLTDIATKLISVLDGTVSRHVLWAPAEIRDLIDEYDTAHRQLVAHLSADDVLKPQHGESQVIFIPTSEGCLLEVSIAGTPLPQVLVINTDLPYDSRALLVRDSIGGAVVRYLSELR